MDRDLEALTFLAKACQKSTPRMVRANLQWAWDRYVSSIDRAHHEAILESLRRMGRQ